jgi:hypothetical protein
LTELRSWLDTPTRQEIVEFVEGAAHQPWQAAHEKDYERSLEHAAERGWTVVSVRNDWATVFSD